MSRTGTATNTQWVSRWPGSHSWLTILSRRVCKLFSWRVRRFVQLAHHSRGRRLPALCRGGCEYPSPVSVSGSEPRSMNLDLVYRTAGSLVRSTAHGELWTSISSSPNRLKSWRSFKNCGEGTASGYPRRLSLKVKPSPSTT